MDIQKKADYRFCYIFVAYTFVKVQLTVCCVFLEFFPPRCIERLWLLVRLIFCLNIMSKIFRSVTKFLKKYVNKTRCERLHETIYQVKHDDTVHT